MNQVYYGNRAYGVEAAAQTYFLEVRRRPDARGGGAPRGAPPGAVVLRSVHPPAARRSRRRNDVLAAMRDAG